MATLIDLSALPETLQKTERHNIPRKPVSSVMERPVLISWDGFGLLVLHDGPIEEMIPIRPKAMDPVKLPHHIQRRAIINAWAGQPRSLKVIDEITIQNMGWGWVKCSHE